MTEEMLTEVVRRSMDAILREYMEGRFTKREYELAIKALDRWGEEQLQMVRRTIH
jgi:hypothetical protein